MTRDYKLLVVCNGKRAVFAREHTVIQTDGDMDDRKKLLADAEALRGLGEAMKRQERRLRALARKK